MAQSDTDTLRHELEKLTVTEARLRTELDERQSDQQRIRRRLKEQQRQAARLRARIDQAGERRGLVGRFRSYTQIRKENAELHAEVKRLRRLERVATGAGNLAGHFFVGSELRAASRTWMQAVQEAERPRDLFSQEAADLIAAIIRRVVRAGLVGLAVAALPMILLTWQNILIQMQVKQQAAQLDQQVSDTLIVRRAQLLNTIYDEICEKPESEDGETSTEAEDQESEPELVCRTRAHIRARQEALLAFVEIERGRGERPDLREANLSDVRLFGANLSRAYLGGANLYRARLRKANLCRARLREADLREADLREADLRGVYLLEADLREADLREADLREADLRGADLSKANLIGADLAQDQINAARGDENTRLPEGLTRPEAWTQQP